MQNKKGIVMDVKNDSVYLMTSSGEFIEVYIDKKIGSPSIGEEYVGIEVKKGRTFFNITKYLAASIVLVIFLIGSSAYAYYYPVSTLKVNGDSNLEFKINRMNKVVSVKAFDKKGEDVIKNMTMKNLNINTALINLMNKDRQNEIIELNVLGKDLDLSDFKNEAKKEKAQLIIKNNGIAKFKEVNENANIHKNGEPAKKTNDFNEATNESPKQEPTPNSKGKSESTEEKNRENQNEKEISNPNNQSNSEKVKNNEKNKNNPKKNSDFKH